MESTDELKENVIKNRPCYYFDDIIRARNRDIHSTDIYLMKNYIKKITKIFQFMTFYTKLQLEQNH